MNWFFHKMKKISFEDIKILIYKDVIIINTLPVNEQSCLILNTIYYDKEEQKINELLEVCNYKKMIIIYGRHTLDNSVEIKYNQLTGLGFSNIHIYQGGMFEWLLLQDIYGDNEFPTVGKTNDLLKYSPKKMLDYPPERR